MDLFVGSHCIPAGMHGILELINTQTFQWLCDTTMVMSLRLLDMIVPHSQCFIQVIYNNLHIFKIFQWLCGIAMVLSLRLLDMTVPHSQCIRVTFDNLHTF